MEKCQHMVTVLKYTWDGYLGRRLTEDEGNTRCLLGLTPCESCGRYEPKTKTRKAKT